jgi:hypothetical protein
MIVKQGMSGDNPQNVERRTNSTLILYPTQPATGPLTFMIAQGPCNNDLAICCRLPGPMARRERRAYPLVCEERAIKPAGLGAAAYGAPRRAGICFVAALRRCTPASPRVTAPCICPPGARAKMPSYCCAGPQVRRQLATLLRSSWMAKGFWMKALLSSRESRPPAISEL